MQSAQITPHLGSAGVFCFLIELLACQPRASGSQDSYYDYSRAASPKL